MTWFGSDGWDADQRYEMAQWDADAAAADMAAAEWEADRAAAADVARDALLADWEADPDGAEWAAEDEWAAYTAAQAAAGTPVLTPEPF